MVVTLAPHTILTQALLVPVSCRSEVHASRSQQMSALPELVQDIVACIFTETGRVTLNSRTLKVAGTIECIVPIAGQAPQ